MRWAQTRGLPVRRLPGGKTATVYALRSELEQWARRHDDALTEGVELGGAGTAPEASYAAAPGRGRGRRLILVGATLVVVVGIGAAVTVLLHRREAALSASVRDRPLALPRDPQLGVLYLQARDDWAARTAESLARAVSALETITRGDPDFAPAYAGLADSYLLTREFGALPDAAAFAQARAAAETGLRLDPDLADAHRALGFIRYWWDGDPLGAGEAFRKALALAPNASQTHFWYGNVLADNGEDRAASRELTRARLLEPGSVAIQTDQAWADWSAGRDREAIEALERITLSSPDFAVAYECLAIIRLGQGDAAGFIAAWARYAELRRDPALLAQARDQAAAWRSGPQALHAYLLAQALTQVDVTASRDHAWAAFVASASGDRTAVVRILEKAAARGERWGSAGTTLRLRRRWAGDAEVIARLNALRREPVERWPGP